MRNDNRKIYIIRKWFLFYFSKKFILKQNLKIWKFEFLKDNYWFTFGKGSTFKSVSKTFPLHCSAAAWTNLGEFSGCSEIFPVLLTGIAATIWAIWVSIILLKLNWFFTEEDKLSSLEFTFSNILSLYESFLVRFSFIFTWPRTRSFKDGWFEL